MLYKFDFSIIAIIMLKYFIYVIVQKGQLLPPYIDMLGNHKFQNVIIYMLSFQKLFQMLLPKNNGKFRLLGAMVIIMCYKALL